MTVAAVKVSAGAGSAECIAGAQPDEQVGVVVPPFVTDGDKRAPAVISPVPLTSMPGVIVFAVAPVKRDLLQSRW